MRHGHFEVTDALLDACAHADSAEVENAVTVVQFAAYMKWQHDKRREQQQAMSVWQRDHAERRAELQALAVAAARDMRGGGARGSR